MLLVEPRSSYIQHTRRRESTSTLESRERDEEEARLSAKVRQSALPEICNVEARDDESKTSQLPSSFLPTHEDIFMVMPRSKIRLLHNANIESVFIGHSIITSLSKPT